MQYLNRQTPAILGVGSADLTGCTYFFVSLPRELTYQLRIRQIQKIDSDIPMRKFLALSVILILLYQGRGLFLSDETPLPSEVSPATIEKAPLPPPVPLPKPEVVQTPKVVQKPHVVRKHIDTEQLIDFAHTLKGIVYLPGGTTPEGFDCSGFVSYVYKEAGLNLPRSSSEMAMYGRRIDRQEVKPGDLMFFAGTNSKSAEIGHVAMVSGKKGKNVFIIHATNRGVVNDNLLQMKYYRDRYITACRPYESAP